MHKLRSLRFLLPALICLALGGTFAIGQTFRAAVQLSQDTSGAFLVDSNNNLYLPKRLMSPTSNVNNPAPTVTGTGTPTVSGTDTAGTITMGSSATTATLLFSSAYGATPNCVLSPQNAFTTTNISYTIVTTSIAITQNSTSGNKINYFCTGTTS